MERVQYWAAVWGYLVSAMVAMQVVAQVREDVWVVEVDTSADPGLREVGPGTFQTGHPQRKRLHWGMLSVFAVSWVWLVGSAAGLGWLAVRRKAFDRMTDRGRFRVVVAAWSLLPALLVLGTLSTAWAMVTG